MMSLGPMRRKNDSQDEEFTTSQREANIVEVTVEEVVVKTPLEEVIIHYQ